MRIGIDIGGTKSHAIAVDDSLRVLAEVRVPSGMGSGEVLENARMVVGELRERVGLPVESVGIGIPGSVDTERGIVRHAVNLGISELELAAGLSDLVLGPVRIDNDVNVAALGAFTTMPAGLRSMAYLNVGTGLAAGLIVNETVWRGFGGVAGEIGHISLDRGGPRCACGQHGCIEGNASGAAIARYWTSSVPFAEALRQGDRAASALRDRVAAGIADAVQILVLTVGVEIVVLSGGVIVNTPRLVDTVVRTLEDRAISSAFLTSIDLSRRIMVETPGRDVSPIGAAILGASSR
ncbi:ROK family protein [Microbacterium sp. 18062]|uniref:ROK family protein n=1 Tax=Microbacterium sp. 18062 TaxID=2681410 RepID=UPI00135911D0|nr:ROK family protein [Microbacterium sp. 18062]